MFDHPGRKKKSFFFVVVPCWGEICLALTGRFWVNNSLSICLMQCRVNTLCCTVKELSLVLCVGSLSDIPEGMCVVLGVWLRPQNSG